MDKELKNIFLFHSGKLSDKWMFYLNEWDAIFSPYKKSKIDLLEIGIQNGGSLEVWAKYFNYANHILGCDINETCLELEYEDPRISVVVGNANSDEVKKKIFSIATDFDIIIDDGSHKSGDIITSFTKYFPKVSMNGIYLIEDLHASYWKDFEGGLYEPYSALSFLKRLADVINFEHWRTNKSREQHLLPFFTKYNTHMDEIDLCSINSIKFLNSMCVIYKQQPDQNKLGQRVVVGSEEKITNNCKRYNRSDIHDIAFSIQEKDEMDIFLLIEKLSLLKTGEEQLKKEINDLKKNVKNLEEEIKIFKNSKSWKLTKPFRKFIGIFRGKPESR